MWLALGVELVPVQPRLAQPRNSAKIEQLRLEYRLLGK